MLLLLSKDCLVRLFTGYDKSVDLTGIIVWRVFELPILAWFVLFGCKRTLGLRHCRGKSEVWNRIPSVRSLVDISTMNSVSDVLFYHFRLTKHVSAVDGKTQIVRPISPGWSQVRQLFMVKLRVEHAIILWPATCCCCRINQTRNLTNCYQWWLTSRHCTFAWTTRRMNTPKSCTLIYSNCWGDPFPRLSNQQSRLRF